MARALLVVDIQNDYFPGGVLPVFEAEAVEARIVAAMGRAKAAGERIILVRHVSKASEGLFAAGGTGIGIRTAILEAAGDAPVVTKHVADAFQDTDLATHLDGIDELLVCGMMTQNCVVFTAMSEAAKNFRVMVPSDLCTAPSEIVHKIALNALASKLPVSTSDAIWS